MGGKPASHGTRAPFLEKPTRPMRTFILPKGVERFLERQGPDGFQIVFEQVAQFGGLPDGEI